jgi:hypothetical protein
VAESEVKPRRRATRKPKVAKQEAPKEVVVERRVAVVIPYVVDGKDIVDPAIKQALMGYPVRFKGLGKVCPDGVQVIELRVDR